MSRAVRRAIGIVAFVAAACESGADRAGGDAGGAGDAASQEGGADGGADACPTADVPCNGLDDDCDGEIDEEACRLASAQAVCQDGACGILACDAGFADCDGLADDGCEASLSTAEHCGACGTPCQRPNTCSESGTCDRTIVEVDLSDYTIQSTPGQQRCLENGAICMDSRVDEPTGELVTTYTHGIRDYSRRDADAPLLYGVQRNIDVEAGARCFANPGEACGPSVDFPPHALPLVMGLPRLLGESISAAGVTPGATLIPELVEWQAFDVRGLDPATCVQTGAIGTIWHRSLAFVADEVDFGGDLGIQLDVLVYESESAGVLPPDDWNGAERMERYYFVRGVGRTREGGFESARCREGRDAASCDGAYVQQNDANFNTFADGDLEAPQFCPW